MNPVTDQTIIAILKEHSAYVTPTRIAVMKVLAENKGGISVSRIRKLSVIGLDRSSVHRTLQFLLKKGLILTVPNSKGNMRYIVKNFVAPKRVLPGKDPLVYFVCSKCGATELIEQATALSIKVPDNYQVNKSNVVLEGLCDKCKQTGH